VGRRASAVLVVAFAALGDRAYAQAPPDDGSGAAETTAPVANRFNLRLGSATTDSTGRPTICLDVHLAAGFGVESCGTGQGILHDETGAELAHFRATYAIFSRGTPSGTGRIRGGIGWAELQLGVDHAGFRFNTPDIERGSVAGPEAALQGQWLVPLAKGVEAIASVTAGAAVFANADQLVVPKSNVQPFVSFELGLGW
jgi:hypothetical protein